MYKKITTVEKAFEVQKDKIDFKQLPDLSLLPANFSKGMLALLTLQVIIHAINNDDPKKPEWVPDYNNTDQQKWFPWYRGGDQSGAGFSFDAAHCEWTNTGTHGGARLALKDEARAEHMNKYFQKYYKELYLVMP